MVLPWAGAKARAPPRSPGRAISTKRTHTEPLQCPGVSQAEEFAIGIPELEPEKRRFDFGLFALHVLAALAGLLGPFYVYASTLPCRNYGQLTACKSNCKNIATALEMYAGDNGGHYPLRLQELIRPVRRPTA